MSLYVAASHRSHGVADQLLARSIGSQPAHLLVFDSNDRARGSSGDMGVRTGRSSGGRWRHGNPGMRMVRWVTKAAHRVQGRGYVDGPDSDRSIARRKGMSWALTHDGLVAQASDHRDRQSNRSNRVQVTATIECDSSLVSSKDAAPKASMRRRTARLPWRWARLCCSSYRLLVPSCWGRTNTPVGRGRLFVRQLHWPPHVQPPDRSVGGRGVDDSVAVGQRPDCLVEPCLSPSAQLAFGALR